MNSRQTGFTLIELMIVVAIIAIISSIAIPNLLSARMNSNESAAIATLKSIASAQSQLKAESAIDVNTNGTGEYGYFAELAGGVGVRDGTGSASTDRLAPPVLTRNFATVTTNAAITGGSVSRSGYVFQLYLPSSTRVGVPEGDSGGVGASAPDPTEAEVHWCCYAWPLSYGNSGKRAFFINQTGEVLSTRNLTQRYSINVPPTYLAAFVKSAGNGMGSTIAVGSTGGDDQRWIVVN